MGKSIRYPGGGIGIGGEKMETKNTLVVLLAGAVGTAIGYFIGVDVGFEMGYEYAYTLEGLFGAL